METKWEEANTKLGNVTCNLHVSRYWHSTTNIAIYTSNFIIIVINFIIDAGRNMS